MRINSMRGFGVQFVANVRIGYFTKLMTSHFHPLAFTFSALEIMS